METPAVRPLISLIVPMYNESGGVELFFNKLIPILSAITPDWEILCINDGSADHTLTLLKSWRERDKRIRYLSFSRNFGKEAALTAGLEHCRGMAVIPLDADLQDPPELIEQMVEKWREGYKVVLATRRSRGQDTLCKRLTAAMFYSVMARLTDFHFPRNTGDFRLMDAKVVEVLRLLPERTRFMKGLFAWAGFSSAYIYFDRPERASGTSKISYFKLWRLAKDGICSLTTRPLQLSSYLGAIISLGAFLYAVFLVLHTLILGIDVPGYASIMVTTLFIGGIQLLSIGILGEYIGRIYSESKKRPIYVTEESSD